MNTSQFNWADPLSILTYKQAVQIYNWGVGRGMSGEPAPNPLDNQLELGRKIVNYTVFLASTY